MSIAKVNFIDLTANIDKLDDILVRFIDLKGFHPVLASEIVDKVHGLTSFVADNPCQPLLAELDDLESKYQLKLPNIELTDQNYTFNEMYDYMHQTKEKLEKIKTDIDSGVITFDEAVKRYGISSDLIE